MAHSQEQMQDLQAQRPIRSLNCKVKCKLNFFNASERTSSITWIGYDGQEKVYATLSPRSAYVINTYVTHPWVCRDELRHNLMLFDAFCIDKEHFVATVALRKKPFLNQICHSQRIFFPSPHEMNQVLHISITDGVYSLRELCLQRLFDLQVPNIYRNGVPSSLASEYEEYRKGQRIDHFLPRII